MSVSGGRDTVKVKMWLLLVPKVVCCDYSFRGCRDDPSTFLMGFTIFIMTSPDLL